MSTSDIKLKFVLVGDSNVGKTSIMVNYIDKYLSTNFYPTVGVDFESTDIVVDINDTEKIVHLQMWDTAGQERYRSLITSYYRTASAILIVFDLTNRQSYNNLFYWITLAYKFNHNNAQLFIIGNKSDLNNKRAVTQLEAETFSQFHNAKYYETSSFDLELLKNTINNIVLSIAQPIFLHIDQMRTRDVHVEKMADASCCVLL